MIRVDPFDAKDLVSIRVQPGQNELPRDRYGHGVGLAMSGPCFTVRQHVAGAPLFCGGAIETHRQLVTLWSVLAADAGPHLTAITRRVRWFVAKVDARRIDTMVVAGFAPARRWVEMLGFRHDATMAEYFENGEDAMIYRLVR